MNMETNTKKSNEPRTAIGIKMSTKDKLTKNRAPGQCYDGFIYQLVDLWEQSENASPNVKFRVKKVSRVTKIL
jgi:hypothetical protein